MNTENLSVSETPTEVAEFLESGEKVRHIFNIRDGLVVYATTRRLLYKRGNMVSPVSYDEIKEVSYRIPIGMSKIIIAMGFFIAAWVTPATALVSTTITAIGCTFLALGLYRKNAWIKLRLDEEDNLQRKFTPIMLLLPFLYFFKPVKQYKVVGDPRELEPFFQFIKDKLNIIPNPEDKVKNFKQKGVKGSNRKSHIINA